MRNGFTLIETMVAITLLMVAILAPMSLTIQSLASAYYARDQITASNLAQEGIESTVDLVDGNILTVAEGAGTPGLFQGIPADQWFTIDTTKSNAIADCSGNAAPPGGDSSTGCGALTTDGTFYGYGYPQTTEFTRSLYACYINGSLCNVSPSDEIALTVVVTWKTGSFQSNSIVLRENLYKWINTTTQ